MYNITSMESIGHTEVSLIANPVVLIVDTTAKDPLRNA